MHKPSTIAKKLLKLFGPKGQHWTRNDFAKDKNGRSVFVNSPKAVKFCISGALGALHIKNRDPFRHALIEATGYGAMTAFNDSSRWPTIKKVLTQIANGA